MVRAIRILTITYIITFTAGIFLSCFLVIPFSVIKFSGSESFQMIAASLVIDFVTPGILCAFIFLPTALNDKRVNEFAVFPLMKRYMPFIMLPLAVVLGIMTFSGIMYGIGPCVFFFIYFISSVCLYVFCRTSKSNSK